LGAAALDFVMPLNYQTVRLSRGAHRKPADGVCVMELASMLAGERFRDTPRCVCPVIRAFLRAYNDAIDDRRRQDLYGFAAASVGTAGDRAASNERARACMYWFSARMPADRRTRFFFIGLGAARWRRSRITYAARVYGRRTTDESHAAALQFVESLIAVGTDRSAAVPAVVVQPSEAGWSGARLWRGAS
jgi:hypothetical protein